MAAKVRDVIKALKAHGWSQVKRRAKGSHRFFTHPDFPEPAVVPGHLSDMIRPKTLKNIEDVTGIKF